MARAGINPAAAYREMNEGKIKKIDNIRYIHIFFVSCYHVEIFFFVDFPKNCHSQPLGRPILQPWSACATNPVGGRNPQVGRPTLTDDTAPASRAGARSAAEECRSGREL